MCSSNTVVRYFNRGVAAMILDSIIVTLSNRIGITPSSFWHDEFNLGVVAMILDSIIVTLSNRIGFTPSSF